MRPAEIIEGATADGVRLSLSPSGGISAKGGQPAIDRWLPALRQNKAAIVPLLRPAGDGWSAVDWLAFFDERAAIVEFDGGLPRAEAEAQAFACCVAEWLNRNPARSPPGHCLGCGDREHAHDPLLPYAVEPAGHAWLHSRCWSDWYEARKAQAVSALMAMGIDAPPPQTGPCLGAATGPPLRLIESKRGPGRCAQCSDLRDGTETEFIIHGARVLLHKVCVPFYTKSHDQFHISRWSWP